jgi:Domain of unknown function (DUF4398)
VSDSRASAFVQIDTPGYTACMLRRRGLALLFVLFCLPVLSCSDDPPDKEMQQAQTEIDAARKAGAGDYAREELAAAEQALANAREAVGNRDYRLALTSALDSRERARTAQTQAEEQKLAARANAEHAISDVSALLARTQPRLQTVAGSKTTRALESSRHAVGDVERALQEARASFERGEYVTTVKLLKGSDARLAEAGRALDAYSATPSRRRR